MEMFGLFFLNLIFLKDRKSENKNGSELWKESHMG
jgi:hypothetical protein